MSYTNGLDKPSNYFNTLLYTGNGTDATGITGIGFAPSWVWIKERSSTSPHKLLDAVRGATKELESSSTASEQTESTSLQSFDSDGFTVGTNGAVNENNQTYASWNWKESATAGFDIVSYTGSGSAKTVSHSLSAVPKMIIVKNRSSARNWCVFHTSLGATKFLRLNLTNAEGTSGGRWNDTAPTSSVFTVGDDAEVNSNGDNYIAYCFAEKQGYSKFGSYTGNGNANGTFVYTGFKPAFVITKLSSVLGEGWEIYNNKALGYNVDNNKLVANTSGTESTADRIDLLSNGFKARINSDGINASGGTLIYMAFAESPFVTSSGVPATAR